VIADRRPFRIGVSDVGDRDVGQRGVRSGHGGDSSGPRCATLRQLIRQGTFPDTNGPTDLWRWGFRATTWPTVTTGGACIAARQSGQRPSSSSRPA
jgi:hypothetical protein